MIRKFECWNCGKTFNADDSKYVECPHCHNDNVDYASFHFPKWTKWIVIGGAVVALLVVLIDIDKMFPKEEDVQNTETIDLGDDGFVEIEIDPSVDLGEKPMTLVTGALQFNDGSYSLEMKSKDAPNIKYHYELRLIFEDKIVAKSDDGKFKDIPPSQDEGGGYLVVAVNNANDSVMANKEVFGFIAQSKISKKMTASELMQLIDSQDPSLKGAGNNDYIAPDLKLTFEGLSANAINKPSTLSEVMTKLKRGVWESIKIKEGGLKYNNMNKICSITFVVKEQDYDF